MTLKSSKSIRRSNRAGGQIEREIAVTDEKIDEIVYRLYGITEEEKRII